MYLLPAGSSVKNSRPNGLGAFRLRPGLDRYRRISLRGLGQDYIHSSTGPGLPGGTIQDTGQTAPLTIEQANAIFGPGAPPVPNVPPGPAPSAYSSVLTSAQTSQNPTDYISPQAAIAAGLNPQAVYSAWSAALAKFPTQQAALAAGVPAGVVTQLWTASRSASGTASSWLDQTTFGIPNKWLIGGGVGVFALAALHRRH